MARHRVVIVVDDVPDDWAPAFKEVTRLGRTTFWGYPATLESIEPLPDDEGGGQ